VSDAIIHCPAKCRIPPAKNGKKNNFPVSGGLWPTMGDNPVKKKKRIGEKKKKPADGPLWFFLPISNGPCCAV